MSVTPDEEIQQVDIATDAVRLVQLTDCHIFATADGRLQGMQTRPSFEAVSAAALAESGQLDLVLATGDLSQDGSAESYQYLAQRFDAMALPVFWLPGNHDEAAAIEANLKGSRVSAAKQLLAGNWQIVLLDSTVAGEVHGQVAAAQLDFLDRCLEAHADRHALVCLHHQAVETGSAWIDLKGLKKADEFRQRVKRHANVRGVLWGHVHQEAHHSVDGIEWMSTPSTCVQFAPQSAEFRISDEAPGYRYICLQADGGIETRVHRVDGIEFEREA